MKATTDLSSFDNSHFSPGKNHLTVILWFIIGRIFINTYFPVPISLKRFVLRAFGASIGKGLVIKPKVNIKYPWNLSVGDFCWIGEQVWIDNLVKVTLGNHVCLSQGAMLLTGNHNYKKTSFDLIVRTIVLEDGVWVGAKSTVCPGVRCKSHSMLGVGSIATASLEPYSIYFGVPAQAIRTRSISE